MGGGRRDAHLIGKLRDVSLLTEAVQFVGKEQRQLELVPLGRREHAPVGQMGDPLRIQTRHYLVELLHRTSELGPHAPYHVLDLFVIDLPPICRRPLPIPF